MSYNEFPTRVIPAHDANAPENIVGGYIQTTPIN